VLAPTALNVPRGHAAQLLLPTALAAVPAEHCSQLLEPALAANLPTGHLKHEVAPALEDSPAAQLVQVVAPAADA
jgi:hypothetical protein